MMKKVLNERINSLKAGIFNTRTLNGTLKTEIQNWISKFINYYYDFP